MRKRNAPLNSGPDRSVTTLELLTLCGLALLLPVIAMLTLRPVEVAVDGMADTVRTHRRAVERLLFDVTADAGRTQPLVTIAADAASGRPSLQIRRARPITLFADGRSLTFASDGTTPAALLEAAGVVYDPADRLQVQGVLLGMDDPLPDEVATRKPGNFGRAYPWDTMERKPLRLRLYRSTPIVVEDGGLAFDMRTTAQTVGEALRDAKITLYLGDHVQPSLGSAIGPGVRVVIERSTPVSIEAEGTLLKTRSRVETVADLLAELKIGLAGSDQVVPPLDTRLHDNIHVAITRVHEDVEIDEEIASFETIFEPDPNLPIDSQRVVRPGAEGVTRTRERVRYENDQETERVLEDRWVAQEPAQRVIAYGTVIEPKTATMADGTSITYWRKIRMRASSYSAGTAGLSPDHPWYGQTYSGEPMRGGVVAVDPSIIPLRSQVYVPGYGLGDALDTGSAIRARRIDLGYDDADLKLWNRWVDVYLLWPPPADYQITWVVPNWPRLPE